MSIKGLNNRGDTIIEVMIVLAVLGLAISISYATANRSLLNTRQAQENSEATKVLQSQIEGIRILAANGPDDPPDPLLNPFKYVGAFCVEGGSVPKIADSGAAFCNNNSDYYNLRVYYCPNNGGVAECSGTDMQRPGTFLITAKWDNVRGAGTDSINYVYRYHGKWD